MPLRHTPWHMYNGWLNSALLGNGGNGSGSYSRLNDPSIDARANWPRPGCPAAPGGPTQGVAKNGYIGICDQTDVRNLPVWAMGRGARVRDTPPR